jgi:TonB family protein
MAIEARDYQPVSSPPTEIVQPPEKRLPAKNELGKHEDEYDEEDDAKPSAAVHKDSIDDADFGEDHGVKGGVKGGTVGGTIGGVAASPGPRSVSPQVGALLKESGNMPPFSASLMHNKVVYVVDTKICVSTTGAVYRLTIRKRSGTVLDASVIDTVKTWRYRPMTVNNTPVSFCYPVRFEFRSES